MVCRRTCVSGTLIAGIVAVIAGTVLLLDHMGYLNAAAIFRYWPVIMVVAGIAGLVQHYGSTKVVGDAMLTIAGVLLLLMQLNRLNWSHAWPIFLICLGVLLVYDALRPKPDTPIGSRDASAQAVFSGIEKNITASDFRSGSIEAVFGSVELDFLQADLAEEQGYLEAKVVFGSLEVRVPDRWRVVIEANAVFGSCENKTRPPLPTAPPKTLIIRGEAVFGSIEVRN
jgi:predicted membrane protein